MKILRWLLPILFVFGVATTTMATEVDFNKLPPEVVAAIIKAEQGGSKDSVTSVMKAVAAADPENMRAWLKLFGDSLKEFCNVMNVEANKFLTSPAGIVIAATIAVKYGGLDAVKMFMTMSICLSVWIAVTLMFLWSFRKCHFKRVVRPFWPWSKAEIKEIAPVFIGEARAISMLIHGLVWIIATLSCACNAV